MEEREQRVRAQFEAAVSRKQLAELREQLALARQYDDEDDYDDDEDTNVADGAHAQPLAPEPARAAVAAIAAPQ